MPEMPVPLYRRQSSRGSPQAALAAAGGGCKSNSEKISSRDRPSFRGPAEAEKTASNSSRFSSRIWWIRCSIVVDGHEIA